MDNITLSDIHGGTEASRWRELPPIIHSVAPKKIILLGDIWDSSPTQDLTSFHDFLRWLVENYQTIWIRGNHDWYIMPAIVRELFLLETLDQYQSGENLYIHGHQFDPLVASHMELAQESEAFYTHLQEITGAPIAELLQRVTGIGSGAKSGPQVAEGVLKYASSIKDVKRVFCGHTHEFSYVEGAPTYYNDGCVCLAGSQRSGFFTEGEEGPIRYHWI